MPQSVHDKKGGRRPKTRAKDQFKVLILDLYVAWLEDPEQALGVALDDHAYVAGSRYNALHISSKMPQLVRESAETGLIDLHKGSENSGLRTRIWPADPLIEHFEKALFSEFDIGSVETQECVVLNSGSPTIKNNDEGPESPERFEVEILVEKEGDTDRRPANFPLEYQDSDHPEIIRWRSEIQAYNRLLARAFIDLGSAERPVVERPVTSKGAKQTVSRVRITQRDKFVRRVFYRGSWELGGRIHGGWWQRIPSEYRKDILINDQYTVEVDYSGLHVALIHALEGVHLQRDPYDLGSLFYGVRKKDQRDDVKSLVLMAINAETLEGAFRAFLGKRNQEGRTAVSDKTGETIEVKYNFELLKKLIDAFVEVNPIMKDYLGTDQGVKLMHYDGEITTRLLKYFTERKIPVLSVHDSYIVQSEYEITLTNKMTEIAQEVMGNHQFKLTQDQLSPTIIRNLMILDPQLGSKTPDYYKQLQKSVRRCKGYAERLNKYNRWLEINNDKLRNN
ncbi:UNVERIFIED_CONTAM: hypothetical protein K0B97_09000 [Spiribacter pallidus]